MEINFPFMIIRWCMMPIFSPPKSNFWSEICNSHGRDILSLTGVLGKITIKEYTYEKTKKKQSNIRHQLSDIWQVWVAFYFSCCYYCVDTDYWPGRRSRNWPTKSVFLRDHRCWSPQQTGDCLDKGSLVCPGTMSHFNCTQKDNLP